MKATYYKCDICKCQTTHVNMQRYPETNICDECMDNDEEV